MTEPVIGEIYTIIPKISGEIGSIGKDRKNEKQGYSFRGIDDVYNTVNCVLSKYGAFSVPEVLDVKRELKTSNNGSQLVYSVATVRYTLYAKDGSSVSAVMVGEGMDSGDKSMNKAMSAAHKYFFLQVFAIPTADAKDSEIDTYTVKPEASAQDKRLDLIEQELQALPANKPKVKYKYTNMPLEYLIEGLTFAELKRKYHTVNDDNLVFCDVVVNGKRLDEYGQDKCKEWVIKYSEKGRGEELAVKQMWAYASDNGTPF